LRNAWISAPVTYTIITQGLADAHGANLSCWGVGVMFACQYTYQSQIMTYKSDAPVVKRILLRYTAYSVTSFYASQTVKVSTRIRCTPIINVFLVISASSVAPKWPVAGAFDARTCIVTLVSISCINVEG